VHNRPFRARERGERAVDDFLARLRQRLYGNVVGDKPLLDKRARERKLRLGRRGEADLDFLEARLVRNLKNAVFCSSDIGVTSDWFPSRKSTLHHIGAVVRRLFGHLRSG
jgi:hypothetical protein